jgi:hypothetical protein
VAQIVALRFTPDANENSIINGVSHYATFNFQVVDNGGIANGGQNTDQTPNVFTFDVQSVADAPTGQNQARNIVEDDIVTFSAANFNIGFADANDVLIPSSFAANTFAGIQISSLTGSGSLKYNGVAATVGMNIDSGNLGLLTYTAAADNTASTSFTFKVRDDGSTNFSGVNVATTANTYTLNFIPVADVTIVSNGGGANANINVTTGTTAVTTVLTNDGDTDANDVKTYAINGGADAGLFAIDATSHVLSFLAAPDVLAPLDVGGDNVYNVNVRVTDAGGDFDIQSLAITVIPVP